MIELAHKKLKGTTRQRCIIKVVQMIMGMKMEVNEGSGQRGNSITGFNQPGALLEPLSNLCPCVHFVNSGREEGGYHAQQGNQRHVCMHDTQTNTHTHRRGNACITHTYTNTHTGIYVTHKHMHCTHHTHSQRDGWLERKPPRVRPIHSQLGAILKLITLCLAF